jgi:hypothetical protein
MEKAWPLGLSFCTKSPCALIYAKTASDKYFLGVLAASHDVQKNLLIGS